MVSSGAGPVALHGGRAVVRAILRWLLLATAAVVAVTSILERHRTRSTHATQGPESGVIVDTPGPWHTMLVETWGMPLVLAVAVGVTARWAGRQTLRGLAPGLLGLSGGIGAIAWFEHLHPRAGPE